MRTLTELPALVFLLLLFYLALLFLHLFHSFLPFGFGLWLFPVRFDLFKYFIVVDNILLDDDLQDQRNGIGNGIIPGKRRRQAVEEE